MKHITKSFAGVYANEDVDLSVEQGEIHALLGENGAGKTTLMNILFGIYQADKGEICFKGEHVEFKSPGEAIARGIGMVHQHFSLVKKMTVLDNVMLGLKGQGIVADRKSAREKLTGLAATYGLLVNPEAPVHTLSVGEQQRVEILKALYRDVSLLILDEPTGVLTPQETENFFGVLKRLRDEGYGIIIITHRLGEIMDISDRVTVLRDGRIHSRLHLGIYHLHRSDNSHLWTLNSQFSSQLHCVVNDFHLFAVIRRHIDRTVCGNHQAALVLHNCGLA